MNARFATAVFWTFCFVLFSKIGWYDLRVYMDPDQRREFMRLAFAVWVLAQGAVWLPVARPMLRQFNWLAALWFLLISPYFIIGIINGNFGIDMIADAVRYALPVGYLLFGLLMFRTLPIRTILTAIISSLAVWVVLRTVIHLLIANRIMRYGIQWEVFLPALLIPLTLYCRRRQLGALAAALLAVVAIFSLGLTRSVVAGTILAAGICGLFALAGIFRHTPRSITLGAISAFVIIIALIPMVVSMPGFGRLDASAVFEDEALPSTPDYEYGTASDTGVGGEDPSTFTDATEAHSRWEAAIASNAAGLGTRLAEAEYFLALTNSSWQSALFGIGAGTRQTVTTPSGVERIVRAPHITYVMIIYRHGYVLGLAIILLLAFYGIPHHIRSALRPSDPETRVFFIGLLAYRGALIGMAVLHQGLIDDPMVFIGLAAASALPTLQSDKSARKR